MVDAITTLFISYAHADSSFVDRLQADLEQQGFVAWVDRRGLAGGQKWRRELQEAVDRSQVLLLVLSPEAVSSEYVQNEYGYAAEEGKVLIPLYYRPCKVPLELRGIQWIDFQHGYAEGLAALLHALHRQQDETPLATGQRQPSELLHSPPQQALAEAGHQPFNNLPAQLTSLIGREQEIQAVCALMRQPEVRLVTITGTGGVGKTRLGLAVGQSLLGDFANGVCFVPLAPIRDPDQVIPTIAKTLGLSEAGDQPLLNQLQVALHERHLLLFLDNFEQVVSAAPSLADLLAACPHLSILVTSRSALHLVGEYEFPVPPLATPDLSQLSDTQQLAYSGAVALFVARAQAIQPSFRLTPANAHATAEICVRLDGLPLAIELAAARIKLLPPEALLKRLSHRFEVLTGGAQNLPTRQQTLHNTLQWSYDLLTKEEQHLFRWLSVFVGGCTLEAAESVCRVDSKQGMGVLEGVISLIDKSLVQQTEQEGEEPRLLMLETIREYGQERLQAEVEFIAVHQAHASYYLQLAEEAEPQLKGAEQVAWLARLEREYQNLRAAIEWSLSSEQRELALRMSGALLLFWGRRGYPREGSALLARALEGSEGVAASVRAKALFAAVGLAYWHQDLRRLESFTEAYQAVAQELGDQHSMTMARLAQGMVAFHRHDYTAARTLLEESLAGFREQGDSFWSAFARLNLGRLLLSQGESQRALVLLEESLTIARAAGDTSDEAWTLLSLGQLAFVQGDLPAAQARLEEGLTLLRKTGESSAIPYALTLLGWNRLQQGKMDEADACLKEGVQLYREQGNRWGIARSILLLAHLAVGKGDMAEARVCYQESLTLARELGLKGFTGSGLKGLGIVMAAQEQPGWAVRLWGAAEQLREGRDVSLPATLYEQAVEAIRTQLGEQAFGSAWKEGQSMPLEQVLEEALGLRGSSRQAAV